MASIFTFSCTDKEALDIQDKSVNSSQLEARENSDGIQDGTQYLEDALSFYEVLQDESDSPDTYSGEEISKGLTDMYNVLWGNPSAAYADQATLFDSIDVTGISTFSQDQAISVYENINTWLSSELEAYTLSDAGLRFLYVSKPIVRETGTYLHVYANIGQDDGGELPSNIENSINWAHYSRSPSGLPQCQSTWWADRLITSSVNYILGNAISVTTSGAATANKDNKGRHVIVVSGNAAIALNGASIRPSSLDADVVLSLERFGRSNGPGYVNDVLCSPTNNDDQYEIFYQCFNAEPCFTWGQITDYTNFHDARGDDIVKAEWETATGASSNYLMRVGGFVQGHAPEVGPGSYQFYHFSKFFYGTPFEIPQDEGNVIGPF